MEEHLGKEEKDGKKPKKMSPTETMSEIGLRWNAMGEEERKPFVGQSAGNDPPSPQISRNVNMSLATFTLLCVPILLKTFHLQLILTPACTENFPFASPNAVSLSSAADPSFSLQT